MGDNPYKNRKLPVGDLDFKVNNLPDEVPAQLEFGEQDIVYSIPNRLKDSGDLKICNLGDCYGGSSILLAKGIIDNNLRGHVYTVDIYIKGRQKVAFDNYVKFGVDKHITQFQMTTDEASDVLDDIEFDFVFIDANHAYDYVYSDIMNYESKIKPNGLIAFHDTNQEGVDEAIKDSELEEGWNLVEWVNRIKVFERK